MKSLFITKTYVKIDANGSARQGMRFGGSGTAGQILYVENSGGENVAPVPIEDEIKRLLPGVKNVLMVGDKLGGINQGPEDILVGLFTFCFVANKFLHSDQFLCGRRTAKATYKQLANNLGWLAVAGE